MRVGRTRIKLAQVLSEHFKTQVSPNDLYRSHGPRRNGMCDVHAWEAFVRVGNVRRNYYSFNTMSDVAKNGVVELKHGEICAKTKLT